MDDLEKEQKRIATRQAEQNQEQKQALEDTKNLIKKNIRDIKELYSIVTQEKSPYPQVS